MWSASHVTPATEAVILTEQGSIPLAMPVPEGTTGDPAEDHSTAGSYSPKPALEIAALALALLRREFFWLLMVVVLSHTLLRQLGAAPWEGTGIDTRDLFRSWHFTLAVVIWPLTAERVILGRMRALGSWPIGLHHAKRWLLLLGALYGELVILLGGVLAVYGGAGQYRDQLGIVLQLMSYTALVGSVYAICWSLGALRGMSGFVSVGSFLVLLNLIGLAALIIDPSRWVENDYWWGGFLRSLNVPYALYRLELAWSPASIWLQGFQFDQLVFVREWVLLLLLSSVRLRCPLPPEWVD